MNILRLNFQSLEWRKISDYLHAEQARLMKELVASTDGEASTRLKGRIEQIETLLAEEKRPMPLKVARDVTDPYGGT